MTATPRAARRRSALAARVRRLVPGRLSAHVATAGLVLVLTVLTAYSVLAAVANERAAEEAWRSALVSERAEEVERRLLAQEEAADDLVREPGDEARAEYAEARDATRTALTELAAVHSADEEAPPAAWWALQERYEAAVQDLLTVAVRDPAAAEAFEEEHVDPHFEAVQRVVSQQVDEHWLEARDALEAMGRSQERLLVTTPLLFGGGLLLLAVFVAALARSRRETAAQADANRHQALHDALTGLPNRTLLRQRTEAALQASPTAGPCAVLLIDLDRFKEINDTLGHHYGDVVLVAVAERLRAALDPADTVARLGGDEFAVLLPACGGEEAALRTAEEVRRALEAPVEADGVWLGIEASVGVVLSGPAQGDVDTLMRHADIAMYVAKERGLGTCLYEEGLDGHSAERLGLLGELRRALEERELVLHFQPKVALPEGRISSVEALVRWQHPERGLLCPDAFIPLAERTALIRPLTLHVIDAALEQCRRWRDAGRLLQVAVNISARNLTDEHLADEVAASLQRWGVPAACLELEMTESAILADPERAQQVLAQLDALGVGLSIDDFGAGYTSLSHLKKLPVHALKIDRSFVAAMAEDRSDALIVQSVVELGHNLGLTTIAEGVEDRATGDRLAAMGCDVAQGYFWSRPLPAERFEEWLDAVPAVPDEPPHAPAAPGRSG